MSTDARYHEKHYGLKIAGTLVLGLPIVAAGLMLCATIVFSPIGLVLVVLSGWPLARIIRAHDRRKQAWMNRDHPLPTTATPPWLSEQDLNLN